MLTIACLLFYRRVSIGLELMEIFSVLLVSGYPPVYVPVSVVIAW